jgi:hypothetical protein
VRRSTAAAVAASALWLFGAGQAQAACADVFSKVRQPDALAPLVVGDSVTVPAGDYLGQMGFAVDAVACRTFDQGLGVMAGRRLPDLVVIALGSNADVSAAELDRALELVGPFARLVLVLPKALGGGPDRDGRIMREFESAHPDQVSVLDWPAHSAGHDDWFAPDGLHLTTPGAQAFAGLIGEAVQFGPAERAEPPPEPPAAPPRRRSRPEAPASPLVVALWRGLTATLSVVAVPGLHLIDRLVGNAGELGPQDL